MYQLILKRAQTYSVIISEAWVFRELWMMMVFESLVPDNNMYIIKK
jgi:hypothetical protein